MNMNKPPTPEVPVTREIALGVARKFSERGITSPDNLDLNDPEVKEANRLFNEWRMAEEARVKGDIEAEHKLNLELTMFYVDAGFTDPNYLGDVLDFLSQDSQNASKDSENEQKTQLRSDIYKAIIKIRHLMNPTKE
ncbi:MAG: hypothetical protein AAB350_01285 [Patescibacteria group bacterium]